MIHAEVHSDDHVFEISFDASPWFENASDAEITALAECGWGGNYPADRVAKEIPAHDEIKAMFDYLYRISGTRRACGFECHVTANDAEAWIKTNRPHLWNTLQLDPQIATK